MPCLWPLSEDLLSSEFLRSLLEIEWYKVLCHNWWVSTENYWD